MKWIVSETASSMAWTRGKNAIEDHVEPSLRWQGKWNAGLPVNADGLKQNCGGPL